MTLVINLFITKVIKRFITKVINQYTLAHKENFMISIEWNAEKRYPPTPYHVINFSYITLITQCTAFLPIIYKQ